MKTLLRNVILAFVGLVIFILTLSYIAYPAEYVNHILRWGNSDVYDYQKFPKRVLEASDSPFEFSLNLDEEHVRTQF